MKQQASILIVDDEEHIRRYIRTIVSTIANAQVIGEAGDGEEALTHYFSLRPDIMLLDINMPIRNGLEVLQEIRSIDKETTIIMLTSVNNLTMIKQSVELQVSNYLLKDGNAEKIRQTVAQAVNRCLEKINL